MDAEIWDLYDARGRKTGRTMRRGETVPYGFYHLAVHIWPLNSKGELLTQRRAATVQWNPNCWAVTGGSAVSGEDALQAARRELKEEIGYEASEEEMKLVACLRRANSFCSVYVVRMDRDESEFTLQKEEVSEVNWCSQERISAMIKENILYNYGDAYFRMLFDFTKRYADER